MITLQELSAFCEDLLTPQDFSDYCPNGLQVEGKREIRKMAFAVSASLAAISKAVQLDVDALIVHHGIFWDKEPLILSGPKKQKVEKLLGKGISLLAYHLPLDAHQEVGNNWRAAQDLGWSQLEPFGFFGKTPIGVKGKFPKIPIEKFQAILENYYGHPAHIALGGKHEVASAGLISGGAHRSISQAADEGLDCYITGSFDEPIWDIAHERRIHFFALGHYATERIGIKSLCMKLQEHFSVPCSFIDLPNPF